MATACEREQIVGLGITVDHLLGRQGSREAERVQIPSGGHEVTLPRPVDKKYAKSQSWNMRVGTL